MKKLFTFFTLIILATTVSAQSIGIGTSTPNSSAQLEIASINKGLLLPRMSSYNRALIVNPANGLLVYDTTLNRLYQYQDGSWHFLINNSYWAQSTTRNFVYNNSDSIGIGITSPSQRLDVNGNIRSRDDILADGKVVATGLVTGGGLTTAGGLTVGSNGLIAGNFTTNGDLTTNSELSINNSAAILQLKSGNVNKGFFQISGNNVRFGTNSGNSTGDLIIRMNGADRMVVRENGNVGMGNTGSTLYKLFVTGNTYTDGDVNVGGKVIRSTISGSNSLLPIIYGRVKGDGTIVNGTGNFTVVKSTVEVGNYQIHSPLISSNCVVFVTCVEDDRAGRANSIDTKCLISTYSTFDSAIGFRDTEFQFIIYCLNQ